MTPQELEVVVLAQLDKVYRVARRMTSGTPEAEDLVGNTLLVAFKSCHQCDGRYPFAWLVQIMRHQRMHESRRRGAPIDDDAEMDNVMDAKAHHQLLSAIRDLDVLAALDRLPEEYRLAVSLCDMEELDYAEAAVALDVPVGTIRSRLNRGRELLQQHLVGWGVNP